ncbi:hypothetical protein emb_1d0589 [Coriobacteriaceae bacterium EMTCatB1]|nr:hypothetical protein emb_1d0589 [Coriobacteriaceae bacterium EMTCatB1]
MASGALRPSGIRRSPPRVNVRPLSSLRLPQAIGNSVTILLPERFAEVLGNAKSRFSNAVALSRR